MINKVVDARYILSASSYLLQQGDPSNIVLKKRLPPSNLPTTSWYTQKTFFNEKNIGIACPISITCHLVMSPSFTISIDQSLPRISAKSRSGSLHLGRWSGLGSCSNRNRDDSERIPLTVMKSFEKSLTPGLPHLSWYCWLPHQD